MMKELENLSPDELQLIYDAPILVCILIAGADDNIDNNEIRKSISTAKENSKASRAHLFDYYQEVAKNFEEKLSNSIKQFPPKASERDPILVNELKKLNDVFTKIDKTFAIVFHSSLKQIAVKIAKSSGGVMGISAISKEEAKYIELPMLQDPSRLFGQ